MKIREWSQNFVNKVNVKKDTWPADWSDQVDPPGAAKEPKETSRTPLDLPAEPFPLYSPHFD